MKHVKERCRDWVIPALLAIMVLTGPETPALSADLSGTYSWNPVSIGAGGLIIGFCTNPANPNMRYCRTDVGNAYRWDSTTNQWWPMIVYNTDGSGVPASVASSPGSSGCEELAVDPNNASVVYMAFPMNYSGDVGTPALTNTIYKSTDGGKHFTATGLSVTGVPNGSSDGDAERMKVDPNNSNIVYYGSQQNGLWLTTNAGTSWTNLTAGGVPNNTTNDFNVDFYKNGGTTSVNGMTVSKIIYLDEAPNTANAAASCDVYRSTDGGQTWTNISTGTGLSGACGKMTVDQNGNVWVAQVSTDFLWKYSGGAWTSIQFGFWNGVNNAAVDPNNANRIFVMGIGGDLARSTDGGATWTVLVNYFIFANTQGWLPQTNQPAIFRSNAGIYFDTNSVLWCPEGNEGMLTFAPSANNTESPSNPPQWTIQSQGIEEFVSHDIVLPAGENDTAFLNVEDATGMVITNPATYTAKQVTLQGSNLISLGVGVGWCPNAPSYVAFTSMGNSNYSGYTSNLGSTWNVFAAPPASPGPGSIAISARGSWGLGSDHIVVLPDNNGLPVYSTNGGTSWQTCTTFPASNGGFWAFYIYPRPLRADPFTPNKFYCCSGTGIAVSTDGGNNWSEVGSGLPPDASNDDLETNFNVANDLWYADGFQGAIGAHGVWHSTNGGVTWTQNSFFTHAFTMCLGAGDGVPGDASYSVYVYGIDAGDSAFGVFRSTDGGNTWNRISYFPAGIIDQPTAMAASWNTYGLVYVTFTGNSAVYGELAGPTPPAAPSNLTAAAGNAQVVLTWTASSGATSYDVYRGTATRGESATPIATGVTAVTYTNTGLTNGTTYYYEVSAVNANGTSGDSNEASATPTSTAPSAPTGLTAAAGNAQVVLNWTASSGATSYNAYRGTTAGGESTTPIATGITAVTYTNTGLTNGTTYYFKVAAVNVNGTSGYSNEASATPQVSAPAAPTGLNAIPGNMQVALSWTASSGATSYNVYQGTTSGGENTTPIATGVTVTSYTNTGLTNGVTYYYKVTAVNAVGSSGYSNEASAAPVGAPPAPSGLTATPGKTIAALSWTGSTGATSYAVYRGTTSGGENATPIDSGIVGDIFIDTSLTNGVTYYYRVAAANGAGTSPYSNEASAVPTTFTAQIPFATTTPVINGSSSAAWSGATSYSLANIVGTIPNGQSNSASYQALWNSTNLYVLVTVTDSTLIQNTTPANGDSVEVYVDATNGKSQSYSGTDWQYVFPWNSSTIYEYQSGSQGTATTGVQFAQSNISGGYIVEVALPWTTMGVSAPSANSLIGMDVAINNSDVLGTRCNKLFWWSQADNDWVNPSFFGTATLVSASAPPAPTGLTATPGSSQVSLSWNASSGATSYNVYRGTTAGGENATAIVTGVTTTSYTNTGLTNGTTYYYKVTAVNASGTSGYSNEASATPSAGTEVIEINSGGAAASPYVADTDYSGGGTYSVTNTINTSAVTDPAPVAVYQSQRVASGPFSYTIPNLTANASYTVRLHFAEIAFGSAGQREFNVTINSTQVLTNFDIYAAAGGEFVANVQQFTTNANGSGQIIIQFAVGAVNNPSVNGIEILTNSGSAPAAPTGLTATPGNAQVALSWTASSGATSYNVLRSTTSGSGYASVTTGVTSTAYTNTGLTNGTTYYFVVAAVNAYGTSANSSQASGTPVAAPAAPTGLTATPGNAQAALGWTASSGATSYNVLRSTTSGSGYASVTTGVTTTAYTNTGLTNGTTYYFVVAAVNAGGTSANSSQASATPVAPPAAPTGLIATPGNTQVALSWSSSTGATSYNVLRSTTSGSGYASVVTGNTTTSYTNTGLTNGKTYYFVVAAVNAGGTSANSSQAAGIPSGVPAAPTGLTATAGIYQVALAWTASSGATSYNVLRSTTSGSGYASVATGVTTVAYTNSGLANGKTYYFVVAAVNASGTSANSSQASAIPTTGTAAIQISCGSTVANGSFVADTDFSGGGTYTNTNTINTSAVVGPAPMAVYQSQRVNNAAFTYTIPNLTANAAYTVRLHFAEIAFGSPGQREFNVSINSVQVLTNYDIVATAGGEYIANIQQFNTTANGSGQIIIAFTLGADNNPEINGIEILH